MHDTLADAIDYLHYASYRRQRELGIIARRLAPYFPDWVRFEERYRKEQGPQEPNEIWLMK